MEGIFLHQAYYQGQTDTEYQNTQFYKIWIKQSGEKFIVKRKDDVDNQSRREYTNFNEFINNWGMLQKDCHNIKL